MADHCRDEYLAMLSHELRNPLGAIVTASALLSPLSADQVKLVAILKRQSSRLSRLLEDLLDASRVTQKKIPLHRRTLDLCAVIRAAVEQSKTLFEERGVAIDVELDPSLVVDGDAERLEQTFVNLLDNAARYTPPGGRASIVARRERDRVVVRVSDDGVGLTPEVRERVFDLFVQAERTLDRSAGGLGVGLAVVRAIVDQHGGTVSAASDGPGRGSCFTVELPPANKLVSGVRPAVNPSSAALPRAR